MFNWLSILYIEDNADDAFVLQEFVKHIPKPIEITVKSTLGEGLESLKNNVFDLVLVDLSLPDSRGIPSIEKIINQNSNVPVVALTGFVDKNLALEALKIGAQDYLVKGDYNEYVLEKTFTHAIQRHEIMKDVLEKQKQLELAQEIAKLGQFYYDFESDTYRCSNELIRIFEFPLEINLKSKHYWNSVHPEDFDIVRNSFISHLKNQKPFYIDHRIVTGNKTVKHLRVTMESTFNEAGWCTSTIGTAQDVTREYNRNEMLIRSQERLDLAVRAGDIGIFDWNLVTDEVVCDEAVYRIYEEKFGTKLNYIEVLLDRLNPKTKDSTLEKLDKAIKGRKELELLYDIITPSGNIKYIQLLAQFQIQDGRVIRMVGMASDVTSRVEADSIKDSFTKKLEDEVKLRTTELQNTQDDLQKALENEKELSLLKSRFVATASHQFRTPLSVIQSNVELISMLTNRDAEQNINMLDKAESRIENEVKRMTDLMDDVLILGKISSNQIPVEFVENDMVTRVKQAAQACESSQDDGRFVEVQIHGNPKLFVFDERTMDHILENLLTNAFKYSRSDNPQVHIYFESKICKIEVIDFGIGIPKEELKSLFQTFYRCSNVGDISGTGLGLAIVKDYVDLNRGIIQVSSQEGVKTVFSLMIPYHRQLSAQTQSH
jgi:signal transduction histidine kinase/DNA-binding NarL/FixJ family response regulator